MDAANFPQCETDKSFPLWITSDIILKGAIAPRLGVYIKRDEANLNAITISFLPDDICAFVPEEDIGEFNIRYSTFTSWAVDTLELQKLLERWHGTVLSDRSLAMMTAEINSEISNYNASNLLGFREKFLECMGISQSCGELDMRFAEK